MNACDADILRTLIINGSMSQRNISNFTGHSLGKVNKSLSSLRITGLISTDNTLTEAGIKQASHWKPCNAIILAAGYGLRMVPLNTEIPKGLLEVNGEPLIERTIKQLHEVHIHDIYIVVGYQKEKYEYLIDQYGVELIVNMDYSTKNNLHSLQKASAYLNNTYIIPCDLYSQENPYCTYEPYDWYMVSNRMTEKSIVRANRYGNLVPVSQHENGNAMLGICYLTSETCSLLKQQLSSWCTISYYDNRFWDDALFAIPEYSIHGKLVNDSSVTEIDTFEQLRELDSQSEQLYTTAIEAIAETFNVNIDQITNIQTLKKGMTNRSFLFTCRGERYIMRIPGEGTDMLINRREEANVYHSLDGMGISDDILYINPENGYKITRFIEGSRNCNPSDEQDLRTCMKKLRTFHNMNLQVSHTFDIFAQINYYESLWKGQASMYRDYSTAKDHVFALKEYINDMDKSCCLCHIDAVPDNFLLLDSGGDTSVHLIDWEYAGMQDPHVDVAMFCIYALYNKSEVDHLIDIYFEDACPIQIRIKIYCYIAASGLLWSNWCEYKTQLGVEFGEYALRQYRYAKDYYKYAISEMEKIK